MGESVRIYRLRSLLILLIIALCHPCFSQFNDSTHYYFSYASTGSINKTNAGNSYLLSNFLKFNISKDKIEVNTNNSWVYGQQQATVTNNDYSSSLDFNYLKNQQRLYYWGLLNYDISYSLKINNRFQGGLGIAYSFVNTKNAHLIISDGFLYETGDLIDPELGNVVYNTFRNSLRIKFRWDIKDELIVIDGSDFYQPSLSSGTDYVIKSNTNLHIKIKKWLSFTTSITYNRLSLNSRENLLITYGLRAEKYF
ncbi:MAG: DUF481 domain-containing protein [Cyclobacteriaceae bacterium]|nr:DUF481 domain-containing protein [Cyclobacteriaceae bacterium]